MKKIKLIEFLLFFIVILIVLFSKKDIYVSYQSSIQDKVLSIKLLIDDKEIENAEVWHSPFFPCKTSNFKRYLGFHNVKIKCKQLGIEKNIRVFTLYKNYINFEFIGNTEEGYEIIERDSWFNNLAYE